MAGATASSLWARASRWARASSTHRSAARCACARASARARARAAMRDSSSVPTRAAAAGRRGRSPPPPRRRRRPRAPEPRRPSLQPAAPERHGSHVALSSNGVPLPKVFCSIFDVCLTPALYRVSSRACRGSNRGKCTEYTLYSTASFHCKISASPHTTKRASVVRCRSETVSEDWLPVRSLARSGFHRPPLVIHSASAPPLPLVGAEHKI
eukprot:scaffold6923_cov80-Phaeocystis_antarctica.AAC.1